MQSDSPPLQTRDSLIEAAIHLFGHNGFAETSTRDLATRAGTNIASIAYHFGGKAGLHAAAAREVAQRIGAAIGGVEARPPSGPDEAAALIYAEFLEPRHRLLCALWGRATNRPAESEAVKLAVFAMLGQVLYFRIGQPYVLRRTGWTSVGPDEAGRIADLLSANLHATIERHRT